MKRKLFMMAIAAVSMCVMVSCGQKDNKANKEKANTEQAAGNDEDEEGNAEATLKEAVAQLLENAYEDINIIYGPREDDCEPNLNVFSMYCTKAFNQLITDVLAVDFDQELEEERFFRGNELAMWNHWEDGPVYVDDIEVEQEGEDTAYATYNLHHGDEWVNMGIALEYENGEWRISDFSKCGDVEASMEALMTSYLENNER